VNKNLISSRDLSKKEITEIFRLATLFQETQKDFSKELAGFLISTLFCEDSTRTKSSFELAAKNLGAKVLDLNLKTSSINKGESLEDTVRVLVNLGVNLLIIREKFSGSASFLVNFLEKQNLALKIINAGDGKNEHPSQALLDFYTIYREFGKNLSFKKVLIIGDSLHSRVVKSNLGLLNLFGFEVNLVGPPGFVEENFLQLGVNKIFYKLKDALETRPDLIMVLRIQKERQQKKLIFNLKEYTQNFCLNKKALLTSKVDLNKIKILHPGPINQNVEVSSELINSQVSLVNKQVKNGLYLRMAILKFLSG